MADMHMTKDERTRVLDSVRKSSTPATRSFVMEVADAITAETIKAIKAQGTRIAELEDTAARLRRELEADQ